MGTRSTTDFFKFFIVPRNFCGQEKSIYNDNDYIMSYHYIFYHRAIYHDDTTFFYAKKVLIKNVLFFPILMLFLAFLYTVTKENINDKVYGSGFNSFQVRLFDFVQPISIANANFFTGVGLDDQQFINVRNSVKYSVNLDVVGFQNLEKGSSNSIMFFSLQQRVIPL